MCKNHSLPAGHVPLGGYAARECKKHPLPAGDAARECKKHTLPAGYAITIY